MSFTKQSQFALTTRGRSSFAISALICLIAAVLIADPAFAIKKCQDENGVWHYGDFAAQECEAAIVSELNEDGIKVGEDVPPPSAEELKAQEEAESAARKAAIDEEEQRKKDAEVVKIYGSEEIILSTRDRKLASIDNNVDVTRQIKSGIVKDINTLKKRKQTPKVKKLIEEREQAIKSYDRVISQNLAERDKLSQKYSEIMRQFRRASARIKARNAS
ncbi:MAG: hypothetical protein AAF402_14175 [Pseudomonadota bacterium]